MADKRKASAAAENILNGDLAYRIKENTKYTVSGFALGALAGFIVASVMGQNKMLFTVVGSVLGGIGGYATAKK